MAVLYQFATLCQVHNVGMIHAARAEASRLRGLVELKVHSRRQVSKGPHFTEMAQAEYTRLDSEIAELLRSAYELEADADWVDEVRGGLTKIEEGEPCPFCKPAPAGEAGR